METKEFDCRCLRPSVVRSNHRITLPNPRSVQEEAEMSKRRMLILKEAVDYPQLVTEESNLTSSEKRGLRKVSKRVEDSEPIISMTDKSDKLCAVSNEI